MAIYVTADLHLGASNSRLLEAFEAFVGALESGDELYILGDLFNFFVGLDSNNEAQTRVSRVLHEATERCIATFFVKGNRDFLMTEDEADSLGMRLLDDHTVIRRFGHALLLTHGDMLCTNDLSYMRYHRTVNQRWLQMLFRLLPLAVRRAIASRIREQSQEACASRRDPQVYGVVVDSVAQMCRTRKAGYVSENDDEGELHISDVVHGHIHQFSTFADEHDEYEHRYVLGAWGQNYSCLCLDEHGRCTMIERPVEELLAKGTISQHPATQSAPSSAGQPQPPGEPQQPQPGAGPLQPQPEAESSSAAERRS